MSKKLHVTVLAELEEWDDTTDAIVWLIEQKFSDIPFPTLKLETPPAAKHYPYYSLENLESQEAHLKGYRKHEKVELDFLAEQIEIKGKDEETGEETCEDGYKVTVERDVWTGEHFKSVKEVEYTIEGTDRKEFKIIKEEKSQ